MGDRPGRACLSFVTGTMIDVRAGGLLCDATGCACGERSAGQEEEWETMAHGRWDASGRVNGTGSEKRHGMRWLRVRCAQVQEVWLWFEMVCVSDPRPPRDRGPRRVR